jgi:alkanesulfonate monooxygenase SsuD/methylene tetrahydromethanopterin reductase-like flavin-dependent oxidoreductase (luciferase family)
VIDYTGEWHRVERAGLKPLPGRQIPIWLGGFNPVAFRRAARIGDGFIFGGAGADGLAGLEQIRGHLETEGRDPESFGIEAMINWQDGPEQWGANVDAWRSAGADYVSMRAMGAGFETPQDHIDALRTFWEAVS